jgi:hypothetical protein
MACHLLQDPPSSVLRFSFFQGQLSTTPIFFLVILYIISFLAYKKDPGIAGGLGEGKHKKAALAHKV